MTNTIDLEIWAEEAEQPEQQEFRKAVKSILEGISQDVILANMMVMKGGLLLAIKYQSPRYTKDIDFSTNKTLGEIDIESFLQSFEEGLAVADQNEYGLAFKIQKYEIKPAPKTNPSFPSLQLRIGYANKAQKSLYNRLLQKQSPKIVLIDFSFNEWINDADSDVASLSGSGELRHYSLHEIVAEKIRSLLQQPIRDRARYQDVYDLHLLLSSHDSLENLEEKSLVLTYLKDACAAREVPVDRTSFSNPEIKERARQGYENELRDQLKEDPPEFEDAFTTVNNYYSALPW